MKAPKFPPEPEEWMPGDPSKLEPPLPKWIWNPEWRQWVEPGKLREIEEASSKWGAHRAASMMAHPDISKLPEFARAMYEKMMTRAGFPPAPMPPPAVPPKKPPVRKPPKPKAVKPPTPPAAPPRSITGKLTPEQEKEQMAELSDFYSEEETFPPTEEFIRATKDRYGVELTPEDYEKLKRATELA